jgi:hypothetical protein
MNLSSKERIVLFAGPSSPMGKSRVTVERRPPARRGDILSLAEDDGTLVVFADGVFFQYPAPTHHELQVYLQRQELLIGTASMGALRAAELNRYGFLGVGTAFNALVSGIIVDDSELAVAMCPYSYQSLTVPAINVRRLLWQLSQAGVADNDLRKAWMASEEIYFMDRTPEKLLRAWTTCGAQFGVNPEILVRQQWSGESDVKRLDVSRALDCALRILEEGKLPDVIDHGPAQLYSP